MNYITFTMFQRYLSAAPPRIESITVKIERVATGVPTDSEKLFIYSISVAEICRGI